MLLFPDGLPLALDFGARLFYIANQIIRILPALYPIGLYNRLRASGKQGSNTTVMETLKIV